MRRSLVLPALLALAACSESLGPEDPDIGSITFAAALNVDISRLTRDASGVYYRDLVIGSGGTVGPNSTLSVYYTGWLPNGTQFDSRKAPASPFQILLGQHFLIEGWEKGLPGARAGGKRQLVIPPSLGYGSVGAGTAVPPNSYLVFEIDVVSLP